MDYEKILAGLVRIGTVTDVNNAKLQARVKFQGENMTSGWLHVLQHRKADLYIVSDGDPAHDHIPGSYLTTWMPKVNDTVLVLYLPVFNADGFVLGGIG